MNLIGMNPNQIEDLKNILMSYSEERINKMVKNAQQIYHEYFSLEGVCTQIAARLL